MAYQVRSLWRNRNFLLLWVGGLTSSIGTGVSQFAFLLLTLALSHSPAQAGVVVAKSKELGAKGKGISESTILDN